MIKKNQEVGILETENRSSFFVKYRKHADIQEGDTVVTSGFGGIYPRGLHVGLVTKIRDKKDPIFKYISAHYLRRYSCGMDWLLGLLNGPLF